MKKRTTLFTFLLMCAFMLNAQKNFMEGWDGGDLMGPGSEPNNFGWMCDVPDLVWEVADSEEVGTVRYSTTLASECAIFDSAEPPFYIPLYYDSNRLLIIRWDGNGVDYFAYKLEGLSAGKVYKFEWVYAWYNNGDRCELRLGINKNPYSTITDISGIIEGKDESDDVISKYFFEIMDDVLGPTDRQPYSQKKTVHPSDFEFTVPEDGDYYLTITCTDVVEDNRNEFGNVVGPMAMLGGFSVTETGASNISKIDDENIQIYVLDGKIVVEGAEDYSVFNITGTKLDPDANLNSGLYIVEAKGITRKIIVK